MSGIVKLGGDVGDTGTVKNAEVVTEPLLQNPNLNRFRTVTRANCLGLLVASSSSSRDMNGGKVSDYANIFRRTPTSFNL